MLYSYNTSKPTYLDKINLEGISIGILEKLGTYCSSVWYNYKNYERRNFTAPHCYLFLALI